MKLHGSNHQSWPSSSTVTLGITQCRGFAEIVQLFRRRRSSGGVSRFVASLYVEDGVLILVESSSLSIGLNIIGDGRFD